MSDATAAAAAGDIAGTVQGTVQGTVEEVGASFDASFDASVADVLFGTGEAPARTAEEVFATLEPLDADYLQEDPLDPDMRYACVSFVSPTRGAQRYTEPCMRVYGCFPALADAAAFLDQHLGPQLPGAEPRYGYDIYTVEMGKWLLAPVDPANEPPELAELRLQTLVKLYLREQDDRRLEFQQHKKEYEARMTRALEELRARGNVSPCAVSLDDGGKPPRPPPAEPAERDKMALARVPGQKFVIVSFASLRGLREPFAVKFRAVCGTLDEAKQEQERVKQLDTEFDNFTLQIGGWTPVPPDISKSEGIEVQYREAFLQRMMEGYKSSEAKAKQLRVQAPPETFSGKPMTIEKIDDDIDSAGPSGVDA